MKKFYDEFNIELDHLIDFCLDFYFPYSLKNYCQTNPMITKDDMLLVTESILDWSRAKAFKMLKIPRKTVKSLISKLWIFFFTQKSKFSND